MGIQWSDVRPSMPERKPNEINLHLTRAEAENLLMFVPAHHHWQALYRKVRSQLDKQNPFKPADMDKHASGQETVNGLFVLHCRCGWSAWPKLRHWWEPAGPIPKQHEQWREYHLHLKNRDEQNGGT